MRIVASVITIALLSSCGTKPSKQQMVTAASLTLKMEETQVDSEPAAVLMLCENEKCINPLRDKSGGDFHFKNYADLYNQKVQEEGKGQKIKMALLGITMFATAAGAFLYIKSDAMRGRIGNLKDSLRELSEKLKMREELEGEQKRLESIDAVVAPTYWTALGISALGTNAIAFAPGIAEDALWQDNKRALADLFIHGSAVKVTKDELIDLFAILVEQVPATVDVAVQSYMFGI